MAEFFGAQLDYIFFFYGLAFVLLGVTCFAMGSAKPRDPPWTVLGLFGLVHGANEWLDMLALSTGDTPAFARVRLLVVVPSFVLLAEFARLGAARLGRRVPGRWIYAAALLLMALAAVAGEMAAANAVARYALCFTGGEGSGVVLFLLSRRLQGAERRWAVSAAGGLAFYGIAAGAITPAAPLWPALFLNHEEFFHVTGVPIQFVRGLLAWWLTFSVWGLRQSTHPVDITFAIYRGRLQRLFAWTLAIVIVILGSGWALTEFLGHHSAQDIREDMRNVLSMLASRLDAELAATDNVVKSMADSPWVLSVMARSRPKAYDDAGKIVDTFKGAAGEAAIAYLMNRDGTVIASSNRFEADSLEGKNYRFRPYFSQALTGQCARYFALGVTTRERGHYTSCPIRAESGRVIGVAVLKKSRDYLETDLWRLEHAFLVDPNGVIFLTSAPQMLFRTLWPLPAEAHQALVRSRQFGELRNGAPAGSRNCGRELG